MSFANGLPGTGVGILQPRLKGESSDVEHDRAEEEDDNMGGFDLAKGFAPIGVRVRR